MAKITNIAGMCKDLQACIGKDKYGKPQQLNLAKLKQGGYSVMCAGLMVAVIKAYGGSLYNGSNTIARQYLSDIGSISDHGSTNGYPKNKNALKSTNLQPGMLVFKWQKTGCSKAAHQKDGKGNFCHIGMVTQKKPLRIVHASSEAGKITVDTKIGKWCAWGKLKCVQYDTSTAPTTTTSTSTTTTTQGSGTTMSETTNGLYTAKVTASVLNVRNTPNGVRIAKFGQGTVVTVTKEQKLNNVMWCYCTNGLITGWCSKDYLKKIAACKPTVQDQDENLDGEDLDDEDLDDEATSDILDDNAEETEQDSQESQQEFTPGDTANTIEELAEQIELLKMRITVLENKAFS